MAQYDLEDDNIDPNEPAVLPKKSGGKAELLQSPSQDKSDYPAWEDLGDEQKAVYKSPMNYARKMMENKIKQAKDSEMY